MKLRFFGTENYRTCQHGEEDESRWSAPPKDKTRLRRPHLSLRLTTRSVKAEVGVLPNIAEEVDFYLCWAKTALLGQQNCSPVELQQLLIHTARRSQFSVSNFYIPPDNSNYSGPSNSHTTWLLLVPDGPSLICENFNAYNVAYDEYIHPDTKGQAIHNWMEEYGKILFNNGSPTRTSRLPDENKLSVPDLTLANPATVERCSWEALYDLQLDHLPILFRWRPEVKLEKSYRRI